MKESSEALLSQAVKAHRDGAIVDAKRLYFRILELEPQNTAACGNLSIIMVQEGDLAQAEALSRRVLASQPRMPEGHYNLGLILLQRGKWDQAIDAFKHAIEIKPAYAAAWFNLGLAFDRLDRLEEALDAYHHGLDQNPNYPDAYNNLGTILQKQRHFEAAVEAYRNAIRLAPGHLMATFNLGSIFQEQGRNEEALEMYREVLRREPNFANAWSNGGTVLRVLGRSTEALAAFERAAALRPHHAQSHYNLGIQLADLGLFEESCARFHQAIALKPEFIEAFNNLGVTLEKLGRAEAAIAALSSALVINPNYAEAHNNFGLVLKKLDRGKEAEQHFKSAINLKADYPEAHYNLGNVLREQGRLSEALAAYQKALEFNPHNASAFAQLFFQKCRADDWTDYASDDRQLLEFVRSDSDKIPPFTLLATSATPADQLLCAQNWVRPIEADAGRLFRHERTAGKTRLRLGYLSGDFHQHATAFLTAELFEQHDRNRFEVFGYSYGRDDSSKTRDRLIKGFDHFIDIHAMAHREAAERIHADGIDILIDLKGHTLGSRLQILASRPAPIQIHYLGFPATTGANFIDYFIADQMIVPEDMQAYFTEKLAYLPGCYQANDTRREIADSVPTRSQCGLPEQGFVFCCFNNSFKLTPAFFDIWMRLLHKTPGSVLWLIETNPLTTENLRREAAARGVDPDRLVFAPLLPVADHLARHSLADLFLDTLPCNAHTTASDALWAGLPVLTLKGETLAGRVCASLLHAVGLPELVADSLEDYEALALDLAIRPTSLLGLRRRLAASRHQSPLFDSTGFKRNIEAAYLHMWEIWLARDAPHSFMVK